MAGTRQVKLRVSVGVQDRDCEKEEERVVSVYSRELQEAEAGGGI